ncbi:aromatase/cyclase [Kitasatospora sp. NPDC088134]|uniref:aromatase/cyclase n=1 Tax=Kitasatospora sp. NPDC088134 TaxID=3364071 RepID=UPI00380E8A4D
MSTAEIHRTRADITVAAPPEAVYRAMTDVEQWPVVFPWIAHTEVLERDGDADLVKFWAVRPDGTTRIWTSRRTLDPVGLRMEFEQQGAVGLIDRLGGSWLFAPGTTADSCEVGSEHWFTTDGDPAAAAAELDRHGARQLATLRSRSEGRAELAGRLLRGERTLLVAEPPAQVHERLRRGLGPLGPAHGESFLDVTLDRADGSVHPDRVLQIPTGTGLLVHKHLMPPETLELLVRHWRVAADPAGTLVTAGYTAVVRDLAARVSVAEDLDHDLDRTPARHLAPIAVGR